MPSQRPDQGPAGGSYQVGGCGWLSAAGTVVAGKVPRKGDIDRDELSRTIRKLGEGLSSGSEWCGATRLPTARRRLGELLLSDGQGIRCRGRGHGGSVPG